MRYELRVVSYVILCYWRATFTGPVQSRRVPSSPVESSLVPNREEEVELRRRHPVRKTTYRSEAVYSERTFADFPRD